MTAITSAPIAAWMSRPRPPNSETPPTTAADGSAPAPAGLRSLPPFADYRWVPALADGAGEIMLAATYAIRTGMTVDDLADTWAPYLTMAESLRIAAGLFRNHLPTSCCA